MAAGCDEWFCVAKISSTASYCSFLSALYVWIKRPQVINKRVLCAVIKDNTSSHFEDDSHIVSTHKKCFVREMIPKSNMFEPEQEMVCIDNDRGEVIFTPFIPQSEYTSYSFKHIVTDKDGNSSIYLSFQPPSDQQDNNPKTICVSHPKKEWLQTVLLPKICKWADQEPSATPTSSTLIEEEVVPTGRYSSLYKEMKTKYGPSLIENWPESTDPYKFVYEDIAIATYLLVLWEEERKRCGLQEKQSFIDLGCGNGLLVYILSSEGHYGKGIDLRMRKIWQLLQPTARLEVLSLTPSSTTCFPEFDWLIGNHSDELTPWIPVMAARSSYKTRYFVLPCCAYDFDKKFSRTTSSQSQYRCYLDYVREIGHVMGFHVEEDTLRIPSSKRVCQIGLMRNYSPEDELRIDEEREAFINSRCGKQFVCEKPNEVNYCNQLPNDKCDNQEPYNQLLATPSSQLSNEATPTNHLPDEITPSSQLSDERALGNQLPDEIIPSNQLSNEATPTNQLPDEITPSNQPFNEATPTNHLPDEITPSSQLSDERTLGNQLPDEITPSNQLSNEATPTNQLPDEITPSNQLFDETAHGNQLFDETAHSNQLFNETAPSNQLFNEIAHSNQLSNETTHSNQLSNETTHSNHLSNETTPSNQLPKEVKSKTDDTTLPKPWAEHFKPRPTTEVVKNCSQVDRSVQLDIITIVTKALLEGPPRWIELSQDKTEVKLWNRGGKLHLCEIPDLIDRDLLVILRNECGGLQTLLRNYCQIFEVHGGIVELRDWSQLTPLSSRYKSRPWKKEESHLLYKTKLCWFYDHHPQGCPRLLSDQCPYAHGMKELRERPDFKTLETCLN